MLEIDARVIAERILSQSVRGNVHFLGATKMDKERDGEFLDEMRRDGLIAMDDLHYYTLRSHVLGKPERHRWVITYLIIDIEQNDMIAASVSIDDRTGDSEIYVHQPREGDPKRGRGPETGTGDPGGTKQGRS